MLKGDEFRARSKRFALGVIRFCAGLSSRPGLSVLTNQLIRSSTSVAANFREACRARSKAEFISKINICVQEADETQLWLELINEGYDINNDDISWLLMEVNEVIAILVAMSKRAKANNQKSAA